MPYPFENINRTSTYTKVMALKLFALSLVMIFFGTLRCNREVAPDMPSAATCYGYSPCNACKNCKYCKYCNAGGTCGVCRPVKKNNSAVTDKEKAKQQLLQPPIVSQCKAITKKGTRCKRSSSKNGYCWQHSK
jgi:hypothetical protein